MLSDQSKRNIEQALHNAVRNTLVPGPEDVCRIGSLPCGEKCGQLGDQIILITISSFTFRLITLFQLADDAATRAYFGKGAVGGPLGEIFAESANLCCGAMNRELAHSCRHLAMSIPYALNSRCLAYLGDLQPQHLASYAIAINDSVHLQATLCMCCSAPVEIASSIAFVEDTGGILELL